MYSDGVKKTSLKSRQKCFGGLVMALLWILMCDSVYADSSKIQNPGKGHWYQRFDTVMTWKSAKTFCESKGGYLVTLTAKEENDFVYNNLASDSPNKNIWLGATDEVQEGVWKWVTGEVWNYTNWFTDQPSNTCGNEHYLTFFWLQPNTWNDLFNDVVNNCSACADPYNYTSLSAICEWDGSLVTFTITASAGTGGTISPSGSVSVNSGESKTFSIAPKACYDIDKVLVNDSTVNLTDGQYTFTNVTANQTISATFKQNPCCTYSVQTQLDAARQEGIQSCKDNPTSCGLFSQMNLDAATQSGITSVVNNPGNYRLLTQAQSDQAVSDAVKTATASMYTQTQSDQAVLKKETDGMPTETAE